MSSVFFPLFYIGGSLCCYKTIACPFDSCCVNYLCSETLFYFCRLFFPSGPMLILTGSDDSSIIKHKCSLMDLYTSAMYVCRVILILTVQYQTYSSEEYSSHKWRNYCLFIHCANILRIKQSGGKTEASISYHTYW